MYNSKNEVTLTHIGLNGTFVMALDSQEDKCDSTHTLAKYGTCTQYQDGYPYSEDSSSSRPASVTL